MPTAYEQRFRSALSQSPSQPELISATDQIIEGDDKSFLVKTEQHLPEDFFSDLEQRRLDSVHGPIGDFAHFARIPDILVKKWFRQGRNIYQADIKEIAKWLAEADADRLLATRRKLI